MALEIKSDNFTVRLATHHEELVKAQQLRYEVFATEMKSNSLAMNHELKRDMDDYDAVMQHLIVIDETLPNKPIIGTYRFQTLRDYTVENFYSKSEFSIEAMIQYCKDNQWVVMELGRSCVHKDYRDKGVIRLIWKFIAYYLEEQNIALMFGCASFQGLDISPYQQTVQFLLQERKGQGPFWVSPKDPEQSIRIDACVFDEEIAAQLRKNIPPLIKGYIDLGAYIGDGLVIDKDFNTIDMFIMIPVSNLSERYIKLLRR